MFTYFLMSLAIYGLRAKLKALLTGISARNCNTLSLRPGRGTFSFPYSLLPAGFGHVIATPSPFRLDNLSQLVPNTLNDSGAGPDPGGDLPVATETV